MDLDHFELEIFTKIMAYILLLAILFLCVFFYKQMYMYGKFINLHEQFFSYNGIILDKV